MDADWHLVRVEREEGQTMTKISAKIDCVKAVTCGRANSHRVTLDGSVINQSVDWDCNRSCPSYRPKGALRTVDERKGKR